MEQENDLMIMDLDCNKPKHILSDADINKIHYCQSYLQIHCLLDMCTAVRNYVLDIVLKGVRGINQNASKKDEIVQERPDNTTWRAWKKFLRPL